MTEETELEQKPIGELVGMIVRNAPFDLIERAGSLERLSRASTFEIAALLEGRDLDSFAERALSERGHRRSSGRQALRNGSMLAAAFELGRRVEVARAQTPETFASAGDVVGWATPRISMLPQEELWMLALDGRGHLRAARCMAKGGIHGAAVRAADPLRAALRADASAFVLVHNHPSGDPTPSKEDVALTAEIAAAGRIIGVPLLDHVVVARDGFACVPVVESAVTAEHRAAIEAHSRRE